MAGERERREVFRKASRSAISDDLNFKEDEDIRLDAGIAAVLAHEQLEILKRDNREYRQIFQIQWNRSTEATKMWRAEDPEKRAGVMPDLGDLLKWLMDRIRAAESAVKVAENTNCGCLGGYPENTELAVKMPDPDTKSVVIEFAKRMQAMYPAQFKDVRAKLSPEVQRQLDDGVRGDAVKLESQVTVDPESEDEYHRDGVYCGEPAHCTPPWPNALPGAPYTLHVNELMPLFDAWDNFSGVMSSSLVAEVEKLKAKYGEKNA